MSTSYAIALPFGVSDPALAKGTPAETTLNEELEMKKGIVTIMLAATVSVAAGPAQTFTGVIIDSMCGTSHKAMGVTPYSRCVRDCVHADPSRYKYSLYDGKSDYMLSDQQTPERFAAQKVAVRGALEDERYSRRQHRRREVTYAPQFPLLPDFGHWSDSAIR